MGTRDAWSLALEEYSTALRAANRSPKTIRLHQHYLSQLRARHRNPWTVTTFELRALIGTEHWSPETRKSARTVVRGFYRWAYGSGLIEQDPALDLMPVKISPGVPHPTPEHVVTQLLADPDRRIVFMAMLAAYLGLRAGEIAQVHARDLIGDQLLVHGKGDKDRAIPVVSARLLFELRQLDGWAFPNGRGSHITSGHVSKLLSHALPIGWTAHSLRHRFASTSYAGTHDLLAVSALLGHSRPETTQRYVLMPADALRAAVAAAC